MESITVKAMAPVVLVHGIRSNASAFNDFEPVLAVDAIPTARVNLGEGSIQTIGEGPLRQQVQAIAAEFGSKRLHIVAHSKGGLWSRWLMKTLSGLAVYTLTTLDTPHEGSVLADAYRVAEGAANAGAFTSPVFSIVLALLNNPSVPDLDIASLEAANREMPLLETMTADGRRTKVAYYAHAGDANRNGNVDQFGFGIIEPSEATYFGTTIDPKLYGFVQRYKRATLVRLPSGQSTLQLPLIPNSPPYPKNDFIVTTSSSWCLNTNPCRAVQNLPGISSPWSKHHGSIVDADVARQVRSRLGVVLEETLSN